MLGVVAQGLPGLTWVSQSRDNKRKVSLKLSGCSMRLASQLVNLPKTSTTNSYLVSSGGNTVGATMPWPFSPPKSLLLCLLHLSTYPSTWPALFTFQKGWTQKSCSTHSPIVYHPPSNHSTIAKATTKNLLDLHCSWERKCFGRVSCQGYVRGKANPNRATD